MSDGHKARRWPEEHWHVAAFICAAIPVAAALLVHLGVLTERAAWIGICASIPYVLFVTWQYTRKAKTRDRTSEANEGKSRVDGAAE